MLEYIENNLDKEISKEELSKIVGLNFYNLQKIFPLISDISLSDYIRKRRLTGAGRDLAQTNFKIIDIALKYGYTSSIAFSRAFTKFHAIKPRDVKKNISKLKYYPPLKFTAPEPIKSLDYEIITLPELTLYGYGIKTNYAKINIEAPNLFKQNTKKYPSLPHPVYGATFYESREFSDNYEYWIFWPTKYYNFSRVVIPKSRYLKFRINSYKSEDIQEMARIFYTNFLPNCNYSLKELPELEYYHDNVVDFLVPIN